MALRPRDIKVALIRHNKTSREIAAAVGLSPASFSRLHHGHRRADPRLLELIERAIKSPSSTLTNQSAGAIETPPTA